MIIDSRYKVIEELGSGVWANVFKVEDIRTEKLYTLKLFQHLDAQTLYEKFSAEEMHHITQLNHPNLVPVVTFGNVGKHIYCVSNYYDGKSLDDFKFKLNRINLLYDIIVQCLYALNALHSQKIYHKDLKPSNILYSLTDNAVDVQLIDYGFNKIDTDKNKQTIGETLPYMAPELFQKAPASPQSDFYSLGVTLYKLVCGILPFSLEQISTIRTGGQHNFFPKFIREINPDIPMGLEKFILKLLEKNPNDRFPDAQSAISFINKIQSKVYPFSLRVSLLQSVQINSYIVRPDYAHQLVDLVENMVAGNGKVITLLGGYGIGKNDILTLFKYHFFTNEFHIFDYTCSPKQHEPFFALIKEFRSALSSSDKQGNMFSNISQKFKKYMETTEEIATKIKTKDKEINKDFNTAKNFLEQLSNEKPLIFIIRECQHLTQETINFINFFSPFISEKPILIIISARDQSKIKGLVHTIQLKVAPLTMPETNEYIKNLINVQPSELFLKTLLYRSNGNPYFIREILTDLLKKKQLIINDQVTFDLSYPQYTLPKHLTELIYDRLTYLSPVNYDYLKLLAIAHTPITKRLINNLFKLNDKELFDLLQDALNNEILCEETIGETSETIYNWTFPELRNHFLSLCNKKEILSISKKLITYYNKEEHIDLPICYGIIKNAELCKNYAAIRKYRLAIVNICSAQYDQVGAFNEISKIIELDLSGLVEISEQELSDDLLAFTEKADFTGYLNTAIELLLKQKIDKNNFYWNFALAYLHIRNDEITKAKKYHEIAAKFVQSTIFKVKILIANAVILTRMGKFDEATACFNVIASMELSDEDLIMYYDRYGMLLSFQNKKEEAISWYEECIAKLEKLPTLHKLTARIGSIYNNLGILYSSSQMFTEAKRLFFACKQEWEKIHYDRLLGKLYNNIGDMFIRMGNTAEAIEYFKKAEVLSVKTDNKQGLGSAYINYAEAYIKQGKFIDAEKYLYQAQKILKSINDDSANYTIDNNLALTKNKTNNFYQLYKFYQTSYPNILENKITTLDPLVKSYIFYLFELGDRETIEKLLYSDFILSKAQDQDFYYQVLAMIALLKSNYTTAIQNFLIALEHAQKSSYSRAIIYLYLAFTHTLHNEADKATEYVEKAQPLIDANGYQYWKMVSGIINLRISFLKKEYPLRKILRDAFSILPIIKQNHYFLLEIDLYSIVIHIYNELNALKHAQSYYKIYTEKVRDAVRNIPEADQKRYLAEKKINLKNITDFNQYIIVHRKKVKPTEWNAEILPLLRLEDTERIKFFLNQKINDYFAPHSYAIAIFHGDAPSLNSLSQSNYSIYLQSNFDPETLKNKEIITHTNKAIETNQPIQFTSQSGKHIIITPIMLKYSRIGFWILSDEGEMPFQASETKMLIAFSFHLSTMLIRTTEYEEENQKIYLLQKLMSITNNMMKTYDIDTLEHDLVLNIIEFTKATRGFLIKRGKLGNYTISVAVDKDNNLLPNDSNFSKSVVGDVLATEHPMFMKNALSAPPVPSGATASAPPVQTGGGRGGDDLYLDTNLANSLYCAPIIVDSAVYGALYLDNYGEVDTNLNINSELMSMFLLQVSLALNNAKTYQSLMTKNWELHTLDTMKTDFIGIVSHELLTPLTTLQGYIQKMKKNIGSLDMETADLLTKVDKSTSKLIYTTRDIMTLNRYNNIKTLTTERTSTNEILNRIYQEACQLSPDRKMKFKLELENTLPDIDIEWQSFHLMVLNLIHNAIRFTADYGTIIIGARRANFSHEKVDDKDSVVIYVQDNGIGIPENEFKNIFKPFYEIGDIYSHRSGFLEFRSGGLGIGLSIVKRIAKLHNAKVSVKSIEKEGSTFFLYLPLSQEVIQKGN